MVRVLFCLGATFLTIAEVSAAPRRYDQRQEGEFNVHAQLENFLFVVAIPSNHNDILSELALQALELKQHLGASGGIISSASSKDHESDATFNESNDEVRGEEIYITSTTAETVQPSENKKDPSQSAEEKNVSDTPSQPAAATSSGEKVLKEKVEGVARAARDFEPAKSHEMPVILGYLVDTRRTLSSKMEDGGRARNVVGNVWNPDVEPGRPGTSMKKQLFRRDLDDEDISPSSAANEKDATLVGGEQQELRLLGDGIENCGPGRRRDASGICVFDESDDSFF